MKKYGKITILFTALIFALLIACTSAFILLCINGVSPNVLKEKDKTVTPPPTQLEPTFDYGEGYIKSIVFIGDISLSSLSGGQGAVKPDQVWSGIGSSLPLDYNLATASITHPSEQKPITVASAISKYRPQYLIITVGIENGVGHCSEKKFKEYYTRLILAVRDSSPDTKIILQSILPITLEAEKSDPSISNERIDVANGYISELCEELSLRYLNTSTALKDKDGRLDTRYASDNGIALNSDGYAVMLEYIRTHGYK